MLSRKPSIADVRSKYATWKVKRDKKQAPAPTPEPLLLEGELILHWELPTRLVGQDIRQWVFMAPTLTLKEGIVHYGRLDKQVAEFYGEDGFRIINSLVCALEGDLDHCITTSPDSITCLYYTFSPDFIKTLRGTLAWICLLNRRARRSISLSKGFWRGGAFSLDPVEDLDWSRSCWSGTLGQATVASFDEMIPRSPLMLTSFPLAHQLAGVHAPIYVDDGIIYHGGMTALVPVQRRPDGKIIWHFEGRLSDLLPVAEIKAVKSKWYKTLDVDELQSAPVLLGWSERGSLVLGTAEASRNLTWPSEAKDAHLMKLSKPAIQASLKIPGNLSVAASTTVASVHIDIIHSMPENYARKLLLCKKKPYIVYDDVQRRAWLVPAISLIHQMVIFSQSSLELNLPPFALPSTTGEESLRVLLENAGYVLYKYGQQQLLLSEIVVEFIEKLCRVSPIPTLTHHEIVGYDLIELLSGVTKQTPKTINADPRPSWIRLLSKVPCVIASNAGELMISERSPIAGAQCNTLPPGHNYMAATVKMLTAISHDTTKNSWQVPNGHWTGKSTRDFDSCPHSNDTSSCWDNPNFLQTITKGPTDPEEGAVRIPETGIVVFGSTHRGSLQSLLSRFRKPVK